MNRGDCTPFIGAGACRPALPSGAALSRRIAHHFKYPFPDSTDLARVSQFAATTFGDPVDFKLLVCEWLARYRAASPALPEPHAALANLRLPVYLTTNYDDFMSEALDTVGRASQRAVCPWSGGHRHGRGPRPADWSDLTADEPLVYHLHGSCTEPRTLVITEDDYLEFIVNMTEDQNGGYPRLLPTALRPAITQRPFLFVGYSLNDWNFRALFHGLFKATARLHWRRHVSIQLMPPLADSGHDTRERAVRFMHDYFREWKISIYWGTAADFFDELTGRMGGSP